MEHWTLQVRAAAIDWNAATRLRPILMTTAAMVCGVLPLLLASGPGEISRTHIGIVITAGMLIGTLFTLFMVPALYALMSRETTPGPAATTESQHRPREIELSN
ncbi:MAG: efflux RND transporter permease subunit [Spongiibacteraceae bacterium]